LARPAQRKIAPPAEADGKSAGLEENMMRSHAMPGGSRPLRDAAAQKLFDLGMMCATGAGAPDLVSAHKWFNLAAMHGNKQANTLRVEIAAELSDNEIAAAQRAARDWLAGRSE
jgi:uncharacterized protein